MACKPVDRLRRRYHESLQAVDIIQDLCSDPLVLREWHFSEEHCYLTARLLGAFTGFAGIQANPPDPCLFFSAVSHPAFLDEAPFLTPIFFFLLNKDLPPLALLTVWLAPGSEYGPTTDAFSFRLTRITAKAFQFDGG
jgi:hypothetical protein